MEARSLTASESANMATVMVAARLLRPYYGRALALLRPMAVDGLGTVGVGEDWTLYVDPAWLFGLPIPEAAGVIAAHEVEHMLRRHASRAASNSAKDMEINDDLADGERLPPGACYPSTFGCPDGLTAEEYDALLHQRSGPCCGGGSGAGEPRDFEVTPQDEPPDIDLVAAAVASDVRQHVQTHGRGSVPLGIVVWAEAERRIIPRDWRRDLAVVLRGARQQAAGREDWTWSRLNRRARAGQPLRPGSYRPTPTVAIVVDTSGSMGPETPSVVWSIARAFGEVAVVSGDAQVLSVSRGLPKEWRGGGGTDMRPLIACADDLGDVIVVVTDCDTPWPDAPTRRPCFVVALDGAGAAPPWAAGRIEVTP